MDEPLKKVLGFQGKVGELEPYGKYFPGLLKLRKNSVVLRKHTIATSACMPSRASIFTGQYQTRNGVSQTDGLFKSGDANNFPWLKPGGIPTIGDWFRTAGYETHYFGKCHFANPPSHSLDEFGFDSWELSYPEPHGASPNNLGFFRDHGFADLADTFLRRKGLGTEWDRQNANASKNDPGGAPPSGDEKPWFAVASFANPHDIATYPVTVRQLAGDTVDKIGPLGVPNQGDLSINPEGGSWRIDLNPDGFPRENATACPSQNEDLLNKPDCQIDYAVKLGLALASKSGNPEITAHPDALGLPFNLTSEPDKWGLNFLQYYAYVHQVVDQHIHRLLKTLEETGLRENTVVVFLSDHGEYGAAHGLMMEKWHTAYQEAIHVPVVISSPFLNPDEEPRQIDELTSHIDLLPTLLGLAGIDTKEREQFTQELRIKHDVPELVGADLSPIIRPENNQERVVGPDGKARTAVLFATDDMITAPLPDIQDPHSTQHDKNFQIFVDTVDEFRNNPKPGWKPITERLKPGAVCQPCHVRCVRTQRFKLVRYCDLTSEIPKPEQWEMYDLENDPNELFNLLVYDGEFPTPVEKQPYLAAEEIIAEAERLREQLAVLEEKMLTTNFGPSTTF